LLCNITSKGLSQKSDKEATDKRDFVCHCYFWGNRASIGTGRVPAQKMWGARLASIEGSRGLLQLPYTPAVPPPRAHTPTARWSVHPPRPAPGTAAQTPEQPHRAAGTPRHAAPFTSRADHQKPKRSVREMCSLRLSAASPPVELCESPPRQRPEGAGVLHGEGAEEPGGRAFGREGGILWLKRLSLRRRRSGVEGAEPLRRSPPEATNSA